MSADTPNECYVLWAYYSDRSGAKLLGVFEDMKIVSKILNTQSVTGSNMNLQVRKMILGAIDPQDIFP